MGRKKKRHKGRSAKKRLEMISENIETKWTRVERSIVRRYRDAKRIAWRKRYHSHEKRQFETLVGNKGKAQLKPGPVVYHLVRLVDGNWQAKSFATKSIKTPRIRGLHTPDYVMPTISNTLVSKRRRVMIEGDFAKFIGFSADDMSSSGFVRGKDFWVEGNIMIVPIARYGIETIRVIASKISKPQI
jgi:hypothetical protein